MFSADNTEGYTADQLAAMNAELADRLAGVERGSNEWNQIEHSFSDEVASR